MQDYFKPTQDLFGNDLEISALEDLLRGEFDDEQYIVTPSIKDRIAIYKYIRALVTNDKVRERLESVSRMEFNKQNYIVLTIAMHIINDYREALAKHDKEAKKKCIEMFKKETERLNAINKAKNGYKSDMTRSSAEAILAEYLGKEAASKENILEAYPTAKIYEFRNPNQIDGSKPTL